MSAPSSGRKAHCMMVAACACLLALAFDAGARAVAGDLGAGVSTRDQTWLFDIPPQDLKSALQRWSAVTGIDWAHLGDGFGGVPSRGVTGKVTAAEALRQLLAGTGYAYTVLPSGSISIVRADTDEGAQGSDLAA